MSGRVYNFFKEYVLFFSLLLTILGLFTFVMGILWVWQGENTRNIGLGFYTNMIADLNGWNVYLLFIGFIILIVGVWYLYSYLKNRKFILEEIKTNKRSEFLKKHVELKNVAKHMPKKYQKMIEDKEEELKIK